MAVFKIQVMRRERKKKKRRILHALHIVDDYFRWILFYIDVSFVVCCVLKGFFL